MTVATAGAAGGRAERVALVSGTSDFGDGFERLSRVPDELRIMKGVLADSAGYAIHPESRLNPTALDLQSSFREAARGGDGPPPEVLLFYYSGHAVELSPGRLTIATADSDRARGETLVSLDALFELLVEKGRPRPREVIILLDACQAGLAVTRLEERVAEARGKGTDVPVLSAIGAIDRLREARQLHFVDSFAAALRTTEALPTEQYLPMERLGGQLVARMAKLAGDEGAPTPELLPAFRESKAFLNPRYLGHSPVRRPLEAVDSTGWAFCGRGRAVDAVVGHLLGTDPGALMLTGAAGSGKSVVLDWIHNGAKGVSLPPGPDAPGPAPEGCLDLLVDVRGKTTEAAAWILSGSFTVADYDPSDPAAFVEAVVEAVAHEAERRTLHLCFDSVDASATPDTLHTSLLAPLAALGNVRVVTAGGKVPPGFAGREVDLDGPEFFAEEDLAALVAHILRHRRESNWAHLDQQRIDDIARATARAAGRSGLRAYLFAVSLSSEDPATAQVRADRTTADLFLEQLRSLDEDDPQWAPDLLLPVALAQGEGLPDDGRLWADVVEQASGRRVPAGELARVQRLAGEFLAAPEGGMHGHGWRFQGSPQAEFLVRDKGEAGAHAAFVAALAARLPARASGGRDWTAADRYTREHFAHHARLAGLLRDYLVDPEFLLMMNAEALNRALILVQEGAGDWVAHVRRLCTALNRADRTDGNTLSRLALLAQVHELPELARRAREAAIGWQPSLTYDEGPARTVHCVPGGGELLVDDEGEVRYREAGAASTAWQRLALPWHRDLLTTTSLVDAGGPALLAGEASGRAWIQRLEDGEGQGFDLELDCPLVACRMTAAGLLFAGTEGWQWRQDGVTGPVVPRDRLRFGGATAAVRRGVAHVAARTAREVTVWHADGTPLWSRPTRQKLGLTAIASDDEGVYTGAGDGTVVWTSWDGARTEDVTRHTSQVTQLQVHTAGPDGPLLVSAGKKGDIRLTPLHDGGGADDLVLGVDVSSVDIEDSQDDGAVEQLVVGTSAGVVRIAR
ncbi:caspase family protein [Streptomyces sp. NPDC058739]|uniref:caspase family protein n=1 Tax=Streptomyces sp. NPDC058739 TaxID=3346618 RepID=UPI0036C748A6